MTSLPDTLKGMWVFFVTLSSSYFFAHRFAYVEFAELEHIDAALAMDNSLFRGRLIKVLMTLSEHDYAI